MRLMALSQTGLVFGNDGQLYGTTSAGGPGGGGTVFRLRVAGEAPVVLRQPQPLQVYPANTVSFSVLAGYIGPFAYQWMLNETNLMHGADGIGGISCSDDEPAGWAAQEQRREGNGRTSLAKAPRGSLEARFRPERRFPNRLWVDEEDRGNISSWAHASSRLGSRRSDRSAIQTTWEAIARTPSSALQPRFSARGGQVV